MRKPSRQDSEEIPGEFHYEVDKTKFPKGLMGTDLSGTNLSGANLSRADLHGANLQGANLTLANFQEAAGITNEELEQQARFLEGATMPDGQKYEEWLKSNGRGEAGEHSDSS